MFNRSIHILSALVVSGFMLSACGSDEPEAPATSTPPASTAAPAASGGGDDMQKMDPMKGSERAEGVVYQDEIYKNWPYTPTE